VGGVPGVCVYISSYEGCKEHLQQVCVICIGVFCVYMVYKCVDYCDTWEACLGCVCISPPTRRARSTCSRYVCVYVCVCCVCMCVLCMYVCVGVCVYISSYEGCKEHLQQVCITIIDTIIHNYTQLYCIYTLTTPIHMIHIRLSVQRDSG
jgi:hypothetical protein